MTALIVMQPTWGQLVEKSYYLMPGTVVGPVAGMSIRLFPGSPLTPTIMLSFLLALCVGTANHALWLPVIWGHGSRLHLGSDSLERIQQAPEA
jgi:uncharacterized membrane protein YccC